MKTFQKVLLVKLMKIVKGMINIFTSFTDNFNILGLPIQNNSSKTPSKKS